MNIDVSDYLLKLLDEYEDLQTRFALLCKQHRTLDEMQSMVDNVRMREVVEGMIVTELLLNVKETLQTKSAELAKD
jgi:hypothetical protein